VPDASDGWTLSVGGLVAQPLVLSLETLRELRAVERTQDFHCVWGWSRRGCRWRGVAVADVLDLAGLDPAAAVVTASCRVGPYASCLHLPDARACILAWGLDGEDLAPENGGPLRLVTPPTLWGYKSVKWVAGLHVGAEFAPGFWEALVGDPEGRVPAAVAEPFDERHYEEDA
jgi:DMSO/TMAO reductase YedYZ molybdopterin-dependent catalytic subunit